jgi:hypothetical protein
MNKEPAKKQKTMKSYYNRVYIKDASACKEVMTQKDVFLGTKRIPSGFQERGDSD